MNEQHLGQSLVRIIQVVAFAAPMVGIIWKLATVHAKIERHSVDLNNLGQKMRDKDEEYSRLFNLLLENVKKIEMTLVEVTSSMQHIQRDMEELKTDVKGGMNK